MKKTYLGLAAIALAACGPKNPDQNVAAGAGANDSANVAVSADTTMRDTTGYQAGVSGNVGVSDTTMRDTANMGVSGGVSAGVSGDTTMQRDTAGYQAGVSGGVSVDTTMQRDSGAVSMGVSGGVSGGMAADTTMKQDTTGYQAGAAAGAAGAAGPLTATLTGVSDPSLTGTATITPSGDAASIEVMLSGSGKKSGTTHAAMIHSGSCDSPGAMVHTLKPLKTSDGEAKSSTELTGHTTSELGDGNHIVAVHASSSKSSKVIACGTIQQGGGAAGYESGNQQADTSAGQKADTSTWQKADTSAGQKADTSSYMSSDTSSSSSSTTAPR